MTAIAVDTRRRFSVYKTSMRSCRRRIDVLQTLKRRRVSTGIVSSYIYTTEFMKSISIYLIFGSLQLATLTLS